MNQSVSVERSLDQTAAPDNGPAPGEHKTDHHPEFENDTVNEGSEADEQIVCAFFRMIAE
jgi:hypothetical protein